MKKILSFFLALIIVIGIVPIADLDLQSHAASLTWNEFKEKLASVEKKYPAGTQQTNWPMGQTCHGYARWLSEQIWGYDFANGNGTDWFRRASTSTSSQIDLLVPGDVIRFRREGKTWNHTIFVTEISGSTIYYTDCNSDGNSTIKWNQSISKSTMDYNLKLQLYNYATGETERYGYIAHYRPNNLGSAPTSAPSLPNISFSQKVALRNTTVTINFNSDNASSYWIGVYKDNVLFEDKSTTENSFSVCMPWVGKYDVVVTAYNSVGDCTNYASFYYGDEGDYMPSKPVINIDKKVAKINDTVTISFSSEFANSYWIGVYKDNVLFEDKSIFIDDSTIERSFSVCMQWVGKYDVVVVAINPLGDNTSYASFYYGNDGDYTPSKPVINIDKKVAKINDTVTISFSSEFANSYWIGVYKDDVLFEDKSIFIDNSTIERSFSVCMQWVGKYDIVVVAINPLGDNTSYASFYYGNDGDYVPQSFTLTGNKTVALKNEDVMVSFNADLATEYWISVYHKGQLLGDDVIQGHTFTMWYSDLGEYNVKVIARNDCSSTDAKYFNFVVVDQKSFTIQYDSNGGENTPASDVKIYGEEYTLSNQYPTKPGYKFSGWNTKADGSGVSYSAGDVYDKNEDLILYALWSRFAAKEGSTAVIDGSYIYGLKTKLTAANIKNTFLDYEGVEVTLTKAIEDARYYGTGSTVTVKYSDGTEEVYTIIIFGDIDGNAIIDSDDAFSVLEASYDNSLFNAAQKKAANVDGVRRISIDDYSIINDTALGISEIEQTAV